MSRHSEIGVSSQFSLWWPGSHRWCCSCRRRLLSQDFRDSCNGKRDWKAMWWDLSPHQELLIHDAGLGVWWKWMRLYEMHRDGQVDCECGFCFEVKPSVRRLHCLWFLLKGYRRSIICLLGVLDLLRWEGFHCWAWGEAWSKGFSWKEVWVGASMSSFRWSLGCLMLHSWWRFGWF